MVFRSFLSLFQAFRKALAKRYVEQHHDSEAAHNPERWRK